MDFLQRIDWMNHNGVNLPMINDFVRNQFYDRVLSRYVRDQDCIDIGFGTGLLSIIALKHGARHIQAFESDSDRYLLGKSIIDELKLNDRIELINEYFDHNYPQRAVTFSEIVDGNLWWEGLWNTLPFDDNQIFLPGTYFLEIWAVAVPERFAQGLCVEKQNSHCFNPGIDIDQNFVDIINKYQNITTEIRQPLQAGIVHFERQQNTDWGWVPYQRAIQYGQVVAQYQATKHIFGLDQFTLTVNTEAWRDQHVLIVPRMGMKQDTDVLYLDVGHWGPGVNPILLVRPTQDLVVQHSVINGLITYSLKD